MPDMGLSLQACLGEGNGESTWEGQHCFAPWDRQLHPSHGCTHLPPSHLQQQSQEALQGLALS